MAFGLVRESGVMLTKRRDGVMCDEITDSEARKSEKILPLSKSQKILRSRACCEKLLRPGSRLNKDGVPRPIALSPGA